MSAVGAPKQPYREQQDAVSRHDLDAFLGHLDGLQQLSDVCRTQKWRHN